ncbi:MAG: hypothetical protein AAGF47_11015, partial [Planctomycetota bacterium]
MGELCYAEKLSGRLWVAFVIVCWRMCPVVEQEMPPENPGNATDRSRITRTTRHVQHPTDPNQVRHLDITTLRVLWRRF